MSPIKATFPIQSQWPTVDPFLFCAYHLDRYPKANSEHGPAVSLAGRAMGQDFQGIDGFNMYHGLTVPGFPVHPHRGMETITLVRQGYVDHADSLGASGRYSAGDVQWMTAGRGLQHSEMFPLLNEDRENPMLLFQIWLNLPKANKMADPDYKMFWAESIPKVEGHFGTAEVICGEFMGTKGLTPPKASWAADNSHQVMILVGQIKTGESITIDACEHPRPVSRRLFVYEGGAFNINLDSIDQPMGFDLDANQAIQLTAKDKPLQFLLMQGEQIQEPVIQAGPFVMNTKEEIMQTISEYQKTQFGGWSWPREDMVHGSDKKRFGRHKDGREDLPPEN